MLPVTYVAAAVQADRERDIRNRRPRALGVPSRLRHPRRADAEAHAEPLRQRVGAASIGGPATAGSR